MSTDLSVIVVGMNQWHVLEPCLSSLFRETPGADLEVIVVDNASSDGTGENLTRFFPMVKVLRNDGNRGFAASNNRGFAESRGSFLVMLNPDTVVHDRAILRTLQFMREHPRAGIATCLLTLKDGSVQESLRSFPTVRDIFFEAFYLNRLAPKSRLFGRYYMTYFGYDAARPVDWACGAFLMVRREVFERSGMLDEQFFMYTEEVDFCRRAGEAGFETWFFPGARITHYWGGQNSFTKRSVVWTHGSQVLYFRKYFHGYRLYLILALKCLGLVNRVVLHGVLGLLSLNTRRLTRAGYTFAALVRILRGDWRYTPGLTGPVAAWTV